MAERELLGYGLSKLLNVDGYRVVADIAEKSDFSNAKLIASMEISNDKIDATEAALNIARVVLPVANAPRAIIGGLINEVRKSRQS